MNRNACPECLRPEHAGRIFAHDDMSACGYCRPDFRVRFLLESGRISGVDAAAMLRNAPDHNAEDARKTALYLFSWGRFDPTSNVVAHPESANDDEEPNDFAVYEESAIGHDDD